ncbi:ubiquitin-conjugating enzyme E2-binding protein [Nemania sp. FL0031]|nr:ubiquitin-conjugating enzyme E2-binding protein [Nemania sp. FL0031]
MSPPQPVLVYAELLSNIRQISVGCTLPTPILTTTRATVAADGRALTVAHHGTSVTLQLPERVFPLSQLPITKLGGTSLSWRLPLIAPLAGRIPSASEELVPWSGLDLEPGSAVVCRTCNSTIVGAGTLKVWKDLPSENWAEMMEFWHCHKPHNHKHGGGDDDDEHLTNRGYGASSRITAQPGVGFVDLTSFLLADSDLVLDSISGPTATGRVGIENKAATALHCNSCKTRLGVRNDQAQSVSIFKWQVLVKQKSANIPELSPSLAQCVSAMLLATMARSGCSKSILLPMRGLSFDDSKPEHAANVRDLLNIWVFNANITFSSTEAPISPITAVKVFYRRVTQEEADKMLDSITSDVQDISLPFEAITTIAELLNKSNAFVPETDRKFKEWTVGLLEKWDGESG